MRKLINYFLDKVGYIVYPKNKIIYRRGEDLELEFDLTKADVEYLKAKTNNNGLREKLLSEKRSKWLDIGCGGTFQENFSYIDLFPEAIVGNTNKYFRLDIINAPKKELDKVGKFDLIRMQHVFEHFTPEDGLKVLDNCAYLLDKGGQILMSTPDLNKYIQLYLSKRIKENYNWALRRVESDSPDSFFFSIFTHSMPYEKHEWCYDAEGLIYQLKKTNKFKDIREIKINDDLANIPFTHKRPNEDVCVIATVK
jgi:predicted SAM-dependent methyltransferase